jgi:hypothetical protein
MGKCVGLETYPQLPASPAHRTIGINFEAQSIVGCFAES